MPFFLTNLITLSYELLLKFIVDSRHMYSFTHFSTFCTKFLVFNQYFLKRNFRNQLRIMHNSIAFCANEGNVFDKTFCGKVVQLELNCNFTEDFFSSLTTNATIYIWKLCQKKTYSTVAECDKRNRKKQHQKNIF